ncbi:MAG: formyltransferase [Burkholderiaceae bacterium]|nr:MAG: formyltransferase [Burkholderiaceae bacterium]
MSNNLPSTPSAIVFAYHNVGVRCLKVLLAHGVDVRMVITHTDNPQETIWFDSVAATAAAYGIPVITPNDPNRDDVVAQLAVLQTDFLFSFYYRLMLKAPLLALPTHGAYNMHGSLLPKFRGRAPVNWAVLHGASETGATLHAMALKPDAGDIFAQSSVPILPDDDAKTVFDKVTDAAERALTSALPGLLDGTARGTPQDLAQGSYFGGRTPEDGRIRWEYNTRAIHNLVRAVAPPYYPGAFFEVAGKCIRLWKTRVLEPATAHSPGIRIDQDRVLIDCCDGVLQVLRADVDGVPLEAANFVQHFGTPHIKFDLTSL